MKKIVTIEEINQKAVELLAMCENVQDETVLGEQAMEIIGDYPLYASGLSNITYGQAIATALLYAEVEELKGGINE